VSTDVADTVEGMMLSLMDIFCSGEEVVQFHFVENFTWCASRIVREFPSEYQDYAAVVGMIGCGATGPDTSFVMIRRPNKKFDIAGDDFFFMIGGDNDIDVVWAQWGVPGAALTVSYKRPERYQDRILRQATVWDTIPISYREK
jgi:hypothetical protein